MVTMTPTKPQPVAQAESPLSGTAENHGPRTEEERRVHDLVRAALDIGAGTNYDTIADLILELRGTISHP